MSAKENELVEVLPSAYYHPTNKLCKVPLLEPHPAVVVVQMWTSDIQGEPDVWMELRSARLQWWCGVRMIDTR